MTKIEYLCIDDAEEATVAPLLEPVRASEPRLHFSYEQPKEFSELLKSVRSKNPNGIILDIRLDENANSSGRRVDFRGLAVAQELRTRMTEGILRSIPIVLWSVPRKFAHSYSSDLTSHDLFDAVYDKESDVTVEPARVGRELFDLHKGYGEVGPPGGTRRAIGELLRLTEVDQTQLDPRFGEFELDPKKAPTHEVVEYVLHSLVIPPGPLVDESRVAAKLGVDIVSSKDWLRLLNEVSKRCKYKGIFGVAWPRWWLHQLIAWWDSLANRPGRLQQVEAKQRVEFLKQRFGLKRLRPARPIDDACTTTYWTICEVLKRPLDPVDGVRMKLAKSLPFHEPRYISITAALERKHRLLGFEIDPLELPRLEIIKNAKKTKAN